MRSGPFRGGVRPAGYPVVNPDSPQAAGLVHWWPLVAGDYRTAVGNTALVAAGAKAWNGTGEFGPVPVFSGSPDAAVTDVAPRVPPFTMTCWAMSLSDSTDQEVFSFAQASSADRGTGLRFGGAQAGDPIQLRDRYNMVNGPSFVIGRWYHIVARWVTTALVELYVDGEYYGNNTLAGYGNQTTVAIGRSGQSGGGVYLVGRTTDARIYHYAVSPEVIRQMYVPETRWDLYAPA